MERIFTLFFFNNVAEKLEDIKEEILNKSVLNIFPEIKDYELFSN